MWLSGSVSYRQQVPSHVSVLERDPTEFQVRRTAFNKNQVGFLSQGNTFNKWKSLKGKWSDVHIQCCLGSSGTDQEKALFCTSRQSTAKSALHLLNLHSYTKMMFCFVLFCFKNHVTQIMMQQIRYKATKLLVMDELPWGQIIRWYLTYADIFVCP